MKLLVLSILGFVSSLGAVPVPPKTAPPVPRAAKAIPDIAGSSLWGEIKQDGRKITISGHDHWHADHGVIRKDGKLFVIWIQKSDGRAAPGLYAIGKDGGIAGWWNFGESVEELPDGSFRGLTAPDILRVPK